MLVKSHVHCASICKRLNNNNSNNAEEIMLKSSKVMGRPVD